MVLRRREVASQKRLHFNNRIMAKYKKKDLISFGNYLLSKERKKRFKQYTHPFLTVKERLLEVHHADIENWKESKKKH